MTNGHEDAVAVDASPVRGWRNSRLNLGESRLLRSRIFRQAIPFVLLIVLFIYFSAKSDVFLTKSNMFNILRSSSTLMMIAAGATLVIVAGSVDLSVGAVAALSGTAAAVLAQGHGGLALLIVLPIGIGAGLVNGILVAYAKLPSFLTTLGTLFIYDGFAKKLTDGHAQPLQNKTLSDLVNGTSFWDIPNIIWWAIIALIITSVLAYRTTYGRHIYAIGGNERVARLSGLPVTRDKIIIFVISAVFASIAGLLLIARGGGASPGMGDPFLLNSIAAIVMGGTSLNGGSGGPGRTVLGVLTIAVVSNGMVLTQVDPYYQGVAFGVIVLFATIVTIRRSEVSTVK
jgi:ribose transport system permease protein